MEAFVSVWIQTTEELLAEGINHSSSKLYGFGVSLVILGVEMLTALEGDASLEIWD